ncbi:uncharacterized protein EV422DRAFT_553452, partial [Fimicolochytrium jonesii]|uniref:uncharacterized protein n=1 Tax=Fimicolochytrium jonesii TaxID=1396493 RepID=UPI0022FDF827
MRIPQRACAVRALPRNGAAGGRYECLAAAAQQRRHASTTTPLHTPAADAPTTQAPTAKSNSGSKPTRRRFPSRTLSGIQPTGVPHLGNYLGALSNWVKLQDDLPASSTSPSSISTLPSSPISPPSTHLYSIVDLHALTLPQDPSLLRENVLDMAASLLACGIDPKKSVLFRQSRVHEHAELAWLLFCRTPIGWLSRMHQWKTKLQMMQQKSGTSTTSANATLAITSDLNLDDPSAQSDEAGPGPNVGLLAYPVLQAADILIYRATQVPIGEDQVQHMELTQMVARSFNATYKKDVFPIPRGIYASTHTKRIMSLRQPTAKMSKSDPADASRINLSDTPEQIRAKIRKATTDSIRGITYDPVTRPGVANLLGVYAGCIHEAELAQGDEGRLEDLAATFGNHTTATFKDAVADAVIARLGPMREELVRLRRDRGFVEGVLEEGEERARAVARETLRDVWGVVGL